MGKIKHVRTKIAKSIAAYTVNDYLYYLTHTRRIVINNLIAGLVRGGGIAIGFTLVGAGIIFLLGLLSSSGIPVIEEIVTYIMDIIRRNQV